jgi:hypothetical protein
MRRMRCNTAKRGNYVRFGAKVNNSKHKGKSANHDARQEEQATSHQGGLQYQELDTLKTAKKGDIQELGDIQGAYNLRRGAHTPTGGIHTRRKHTRGRYKRGK